MSLVRRVAASAATAVVAVACGTGQEAGTPASSDVPPPTTSEAVATTTTAASSTTTTTAPTTTTTDPVEAVPLSDLEAGTANGVGWLGEPGVYEFPLEGRNIRIEMTEAFTFIPSLSGSVLMLAPAEIPDTGFQINMFALTEFAGVIPADQIGIHQPHEPTVPEVTQPIPRSLADWIETVPQMISATGPVYEGNGYSAVSWDIMVDAEAGETFPCDYGNCLGVLAQPNAGVWVMGDDFGFRLWQFDGERNLVGFGQAPVDELAAAEAFYERVLAGLSISSGG